MKKVLLIAVLFAVSFSSFAQRFTSEVFTDVKVTESVIYGVNATIALVANPNVGEAVPQPLIMDVYEPEGDTSASRPLVVMLHTGNFVPPQFNGGCTGTVKDADLVEMATRLAKMGYVAAIADYRLGWDPTNGEQSIRVYTLINAAYRGVQDARTAVRFFRKDAAENGNTFGINPDQVATWGNGTGGYISAATAALDTITDTWIPKFFLGANPMVIEGINGNVDGTTVGIMPPGIPSLPFPPGDTLCYPNHVGYSSEISLAVNLGGALGDTSWMDADDPMIMSFHVPTDPFAPCTEGIVNVPPPINLPVLEVQGSCLFQQVANDLGLNNAWVDEGFSDDISNVATSRNGGIEGLLLFPSTDPTEAAQWNYSASAEPYGIVGSDCNTDAATSGVYIDSIFAYFAPRACIALGLDCDSDVSTKNLDPSSIGLSIAPNPSMGTVRIQTKGVEFQAVRVFDLQGKMISNASNLNTNSFDLERNGIPNGMYLVQLQLENGISTQKLVFN